MNKDRRDARSIFTGVRPAILIVTVVIASFYLWGALRLGLVNYGTPGPGVFPLLSALLVITMALASFLEMAAHEPKVDQPIEDRSRLLIYTGAMLLWALSFSYLGFVTSSAIAILIVVVLGEGQSLVFGFAVTVTCTLISWFLFQKVLSVPLPAGMLFR